MNGMEMETKMFLRANERGIISGVYFHPAEMSNTWRCPRFLMEFYPPYGGITGLWRTCPAYGGNWPGTRGIVDT